ncbi:hybrid sensor histidine kinase/response regulator [Desulfovibrio inopinatus]|uniref:hybrid sensor histidine kinase/response regulator n=1 Tax=Desulfovibrio inopinatus TaxID=102109 RepID=UPI000423C7CB|nr:PAS domain-containing sensor histidine kinase [Desulfovibrio inopinatus]
MSGVDRAKLIKELAESGSSIHDNDLVARLLNALTDKVFLLDRHMRVVWMNDVARQAAVIDIDKEISSWPCHEVFFHRGEPCPFCPIRDLKPEKEPLVFSMCDASGVGWDIAAIHAPQGTFVSAGRNDGSFGMDGQAPADSPKTDPDAVRARTHRQLTRLRETLRREKDTLLAALENLPVLAVVLGRDNLLLFANSAFTAITGYTLEDVPDLDTWLIKAYPDPTYRTFVQYVWQGDRSQGKSRRRFTIHRKDGEARSIDFHIMYLADGRSIVSGNDVTDALLAEEALKESETRLRLALEATSDGVFDFYLTTGAMYTSPGWVERLGYAASQEQDQIEFWKSLIHPEDMHRVQKLFAAHASGETAFFRCEMRLKTREGGWRWTLSRGRVMEWDEGRPTRLVGSHMDIEEYKRTEAALRESEKKYRELFEHISGGIFQSTPEGRFLNANPAMARILGYDSVEDILQVDDLARVIYDDLLDREALMHILEDYSRVQGYEVRAVRKDGRHIWLSLTANAVRDESGRFVRVEGIAEDVTARRRAEDERMLLVAAVEQSAEGVVITNSIWQVEYANPAFGEIIGVHPKDIIGRNVFALSNATPDPSMEEAIQSEIELHAEWSGLVRGKRDAPFVVETVIAPVRDDFGRVTSYIILARDVTYEDRLEDRLRQSQKLEAIGTLAGGIAHDFNNILTPIILNTEIALFDIDEDAPIRGPLEDVIRAGEQARDLIKQILTFSRQGEEARHPLFLAPVIKETLKLIRASLPPSVEIEQDLDDAGYQVLAGPAQIHQIVMNLCTNATHAMGLRGGRLSLRLQHRDIVNPKTQARSPEVRPGSYLCLDVTDSGHGMNSDIVDRVFEPFFTTKKPGEGTGMGLATVHGIVKSLGGAVWIESELDQGTTVHIYFPAISATNERHDPKPIDPLPRGREHILIVDDRGHSLASCSTTLERLGYTVSAVKNPVRAAAMVQAEPDAFDLLVTDHLMPEMNGFELAKKVLSIRPDLPIIVLTGFTGRFLKADVIEQGLTDVVYKPVAASPLAKAVRAALDRSRRHVTGKGRVHGHYDTLFDGK